MDTGAIRRRLALGMGVLTASGLLAVAAPGQAQAASGPCPGHKIRTFTFSTGALKLYKSGNYLCAVTVPKNPGAERRMTVSLRVRGFRPIEDKGHYTKYAGPVRAYVGHRKVWLKASVGGGSYDSDGWKRY